MTGTGSRMSARKRWAFTLVVIAEVLFIAYLVAEAFRAGDERRTWFLLGAGGLSLLVGSLIWSRRRKHAPRS